MNRLGVRGRMNRSGDRARRANKDLLMPQAANLVRCWSLRRCVPAYKLGNAVRTTAGSGGIEADYPFTHDGIISIGGPVEHRVNTLYEQNGGNILRQATFANMPIVYDASTGLRKGPDLFGTQVLQAATTDTVFNTAFVNNATDGFTIALWLRTRTVTATRDIIGLRNATQGYLRLFQASAILRMWIQSGTNRTITTALTANVWHHLVLTMIGTGATALTTYYNRDTVKQYPSETPSVGTVLLHVGRWVADADSLVNDICVWNRALNAADVATLYNAQAPYYA